MWGYKNWGSGGSTECPPAVRFGFSHFLAGAYGRNDGQLTFRREFVFIIVPSLHHIRTKNIDDVIALCAVSGY